MKVTHPINAFSSQKLKRRVCNAAAMSGRDEQSTWLHFELQSGHQMIGCAWEIHTKAS